MQINNMPEYAQGKQFIACRPVDGELWFWGAWDDCPIQNMSERAYSKQFIVVREVDEEFWYWGAWDDVGGAYEAAVNEGGFIFVNVL